MPLRSRFVMPDLLGRLSKVQKPAVSQRSGTEVMGESHAPFEASVRARLLSRGQFDAEPVSRQVPQRLSQLP